MGTPLRRECTPEKGNQYRRNEIPKIKRCRHCSCWSFLARILFLTLRVMGSHEAIGEDQSGDKHGHIYTLAKITQTTMCRGNRVSMQNPIQRLLLTFRQEIKVPVHVSLPWPIPNLIYSLSPDTMYLINILYFSFIILITTVDVSFLCYSFLMTAHPLYVAMSTGIASVLVTSFNSSI